MIENNINNEEEVSSSVELASAQLVEQEVQLNQKEQERQEYIKKDKMSSKLITCLVFFIIPILGPIIFLSVIKPQDKVIKTLSIISIFGLNWLFIFFLLGFYKESFWEKNLI